MPFIFKEGIRTFGVARYVPPPSFASKVGVCFPQTRRPELTHSIPSQPTQSSEKPQRSVCTGFAGGHARSVTAMPTRTATPHISLYFQLVEAGNGRTLAAEKAGLVVVAGAAGASADRMNSGLGAGTSTALFEVAGDSRGFPDGRERALAEQHAAIEPADVRKEIGPLRARADGQAHQWMGRILRLGVVDRLSISVGADLGALVAGVVVERISGPGRVDLVDGAWGAHGEAYVAQECRWLGWLTLIRTFSWAGEVYERESQWGARASGLK